MNPKLAETIYVDFITSSPTTGAAIDADSLPTCEIFEDTTDTSILSPTVVKRTGKTGNYRIPIVCTSANGFEASKSYNAIVSATVGTVAAKAVASTFQLRTNSEDDPVTLTSAYDAAKTAASQASITTLTAYVDTEVAAILAAVDTEISAIKAKTDALPIDPADASEINASFSVITASLSTLQGYVDTEVASIKAKTDNLPADPASASSISASFAATDSKLDDVDEVTTKLDTMLQSDGIVWQYTENALELAPVGSGGPVEPSPTPSELEPCAQNPAQTKGPTTVPYSTSATALTWRPRAKPRSIQAQSDDCGC